MSFQRIDIFFIIKIHIKAIYDSLWLFIAIPIIISAFFIYFMIFLSTESISIIITSLSIFIALFFNASILLLDIKKRVGNNIDRKQSLQETHNCISFLILIGLFTIIVCYIALSTNNYIKIVANSLAYFLLSLFFLTTTMAIKNVHILFNDDIERSI